MGSTYARQSSLLPASRLPLDLLLAPSPFRNVTSGLGVWSFVPQCCRVLCCGQRANPHNLHNVVSSFLSCMPLRCAASHMDFSLATAMNIKIRQLVSVEKKKTRTRSSFPSTKPKAFLSLQWCGHRPRSCASVSPLCPFATSSSLENPACRQCGINLYSRLAATTTTKPETAQAVPNRRHGRR